MQENMKHIGLESRNIQNNLNQVKNYEKNIKNPETSTETLKRNTKIPKSVRKILKLLYSFQDYLNVSGFLCTGFSILYIRFRFFYVFQNFL